MRAIEWTMLVEALQRIGDGRRQRERINPRAFVVLVTQLAFLDGECVNLFAMVHRPGAASADGA
ncbi:MAG: hypothetical protein SFX73_21985 [Kofleriaceae bacterium]|nr:hypothetical protein [Kofleriaceae bacterium]